MTNEAEMMREALERMSPANRDCIAKAKPGEPMFIILGRDPDGATIVKLWADRRAEAGDREHAETVWPIAEAMRAWAADPANAPESAPPAEAYPALTAWNTRAERVGVGDLEARVDELFRKIYHSVVTKYQPEAAKRCIRAALQQGTGHDD